MDRSAIAIARNIDNSAQIRLTCVVFALRKYPVPRRTKAAFVPTRAPALGNYQRSYSSTSFRESLARDCRRDGYGQPPLRPADFTREICRGAPRAKDSKIRLGSRLALARSVWVRFL